ncbi:hypothetical protein LSTR_LSTR011145 [Laodelphax striatellus]|uniref:Uncharacterized protein n=1 Tax=Laodelphax striatellus TaxID=195883 RepID=A0A482XM92_LAOST|nr:hypothetical protein LSTR_LSTR011145 [Laodelphax striatellus]
MLFWPLRTEVRQVKSFKPPRPPALSFQCKEIQPDSAFSWKGSCIYPTAKRKPMTMITAARLKLPKQHLLMTPVNYRKLHLLDVEIPENQVCIKVSDYVEKGREIVGPAPTPTGNSEMSLALRRLGATYRSAFTFATGAVHWEVLLRSRQPVLCDSGRQLA